MKHIESTSWCMDTEEIINAARYVSSAQKEILNNIQHIDSQLRDDCIRVQGIINRDKFFNLLYKELIAFNGILKARDSKNFIVEMYIDIK